ncbi:uncharacterized protein [Rutidosis leptorrhynchoides]|uniref:uncharacterized protein n=1 Tax=Rutidosis leptorrhynchoides TaxID=125765 RepID=UPI003A9A3879
MEGIGSRTGRPSSRYGSTPVFTGPVRRWQKQWVHVSSSSSSVTYNHHNSNSNNNNDVSAVRIRRWTPIPADKPAGDSDSVPEERPRRKLRYAPIVVLEAKKKEAEKDDVNDVKESSKISQPTDRRTSENDDNVIKTKAQVLEKSAPMTKDLNDNPMDMDTASEDHDEDRDLGGAEKVADWVKAAQRGFAR